MVDSIQGDGGKARWAEDYKSPVLIDGVAVGTVGFAHDLTEMKRLHDDISQTKSEYVSLVETCHWRLFATT